MNRLRLGLAVSLSGRYALLGRQVEAGVRAFVAYAETESSHRIGQQPTSFELTVIDDESDPERLQTALAELVDHHRVDLLLGPYGSGLGISAARFARERQMVLWNHSSSADQIFAGASSWTVGIITTASRYLTGVIDLMAYLAIPINNAALIAAETGFARDMATGFVDTAAAANITTSRYDYPSGTCDFDDIVTALCIQRPDVIVATGRVEDDLRLARSLIEARPQCSVCALVVAGIDEFRRRFGNDANGFVAPSQWEIEADYAVDFGPSSREFARFYRRVSTLPLDYPAAQGFVGALIASHCAQRCGSTNQSDLREAARNLTGTTFYGPYAIDPASGRQIGDRILLTQWQQGERKIVWPRTVATATVRPPFANG